MTILLPLLGWLVFASLRIAVVLVGVRALHGFWLTDSSPLLLVALPFLIELLSLLRTPLPPRVENRNDARQQQIRRSYLSTRSKERRNNIRVNLFYLLLPGAISFVAYIAALIVMGDSLEGDTEETLRWAFGVSAVVWFSSLLTLSFFGPDYGPPPEATHHSRATPAKEPVDSSRTLGMDTDTPGDEW